MASSAHFPQSSQAGKDCCAGAVLVSASELVDEERFTISLSVYMSGLTGMRAPTFCLVHALPLAVNRMGSGSSVQEMPQIRFHVCVLPGSTNVESTESAPGGGEPGSIVNGSM